MIANSILLGDALQQMEEATEGFTLRFVKASRTRKTGGKIEEWHNCRLSRPRHVKGKAKPEKRVPVPATSRQPSHYTNATRNITVGNSGQRRKVQIWLILSLNGQKVL
ncbi:hypothetical protein [Hymenobacter crusticola]|uniref:Uncharacterized protein n=1 Tax=Hymenobacter crusticola TaxID=1770526 RepID=A0A243W606_9BACT|nr:hypothetical protein [Hymenobacter crusticola]OUJ68821.1 hypothetical protein BXP70_27375 [Hymenobacter crusticola]